ncbi:MAG: ECF-type sigma factor [Phycisphaerae bacterium]|jgi:RNA polymerase sigma factor (TIGR02999 family)
MIDNAKSGDATSSEVLVNALYDRLRSLAAATLQSEQVGHTLQPTALVHEAWIKLAASENLDQAGRNTFMAAAAKTMRRVLIDHARIKKAQKRGGGEMKVELTDAESPAPSTEVDIEALDVALDEFAAKYPRQHRVVEMKYFANLTVKQIAEILGLGERSVANDWVFASAWLRSRLDKSQ